MSRVASEIREERRIAGGRRVVLTLHAPEEHVPGVLLLPVASGDGAAARPAALLLHGLTSSKEQMASSVGQALLARGMASLSIDFPLHGDREGALDELSARNPMGLLRRWRMALADCALSLRFLETHPAIDADRLGLVGYSLGAFLGVITAARESSVRAIVLAAGGDLPDGSPFGGLVRAVADPIRAVRALDGRPLLMVQGRRDRTVRPEQAERLFAAANEPKTLRWWDSGHWLPSAAIDDAAEWLGEKLRERSSITDRRETG